MGHRNTSPWRALATVASTAVLALALATAATAGPSLDLSGFGAGIGIRARDGTTVGVLTLSIQFDSDTKTLVDSWDARSKLGKLGKGIVATAVSQGRLYLIAESVDMSAPSRVDDPRFYPGVGVQIFEAAGVPIEVGAYHSNDAGWTWLIRGDLIRLE